MLTYTPPSEQALPTPTEKPWLLMLLCVVWLLPGVLGREPLKPDETLIADIVKHILGGHSLLVPLVAGEAHLERSPGFYWLATLFAGWGQWAGLALHDGARLASTACMAITLWCTGLSARLLIGRRHGRSAVLILVGCVGLLLPGHQLSTDTGVLAAWSLGLLALAWSRQQPVSGGIVLGCALCLLGLADSVAEAGMLLLVAFSLLAFPGWQGARYPIGLLISVTISLPVLLAWPLALGRSDPALFVTWWNNFALGRFGGFADLQLAWPRWRHAGLLSWFAWPAWLLASATLWMQRDRLAQPRFQLPLAAAIVALLAFVISARGRTGDLLPLLPPLALIGAAGLDYLRRGASAFLNWFGVMALGLLALYLWGVGLAVQWGVPAVLAARLAELSPGFEGRISWLASAIGLLLTLVWLWAVSRRRPMGRQAATNWAAGITLCWGLFGAFAMDWVNYSASYRGVSRQLQAALPAKPGCILGENLGPSQRAVFHYYLDLNTRPVLSADARQCEWRLRQAGKAITPTPKGWEVAWQGARPGDRSERYILFKRVPVQAGNGMGMLSEQTNLSQWTERPE